MDALQTLIEIAYCTALGEMTYGDFLAATNDALGFGASGIVASRPDGPGHYCVATHNIDIATCDAAERTFGVTAGVANNTRSVMSSGSVHRREELISLHDLQRQPCYEAFIRPNGVQDGIMVCLDRSPDRQVLVTFARPARAADAERQAAQLRELAPHMVRGMHITRSLSQLELLRRAQTETLNLHPYPLVLYDNFGRLYAANRAAEERLAAHGGLRLTAAGLQAASPMDDRRLQQAIRAVIASTNSAELPLTSQDLRLTPVAGARACHLICVPLPPAHYGPGRRPAAVVLVHDPDSELQVSAQRLRDVFGLTRAEAQVAIGIMRGRSPDEIASQQRNSIATVRNLLKRIYHKTGVSRQNELAVLLLRAPLQLDLASQLSAHADSGPESAVSPRSA